MEKLVTLGSASAIPGEQQENTHLLVVAGNRCVLIDCASNPIQHLRRGGVTFEALTDIILTHFHPDHVSGIPLLLMGMWLMGRRQPLSIYGIPHTLDRMEAMMDLFEWKRWPGFYPVDFVRVAEKEMALVCDFEELRVFASPVKHLIPTIGLRLEFLRSGKIAAYSSDTEPCRQVVRLAENADILIHEAAGESLGHSSPAQAAEIAGQARAHSLYLIHYSPEKDHAGLLLEAKKVFPGPVDLAWDFMTLSLGEELS